jgi:hypothetical protein
MSMPRLAAAASRSGLSGTSVRPDKPLPCCGDDIIAAIEDVANDPASIRLTGRGRRIILIGMRKSVSITVVANPGNGFIVTGFPT